MEMNTKSYQIQFSNRYSMNALLKPIVFVFTVGFFVYVAFGPRLLLIENAMYASNEGETRSLNSGIFLSKAKKHFNLLDDDTWRMTRYYRRFISEDCTIDFINTNKLQQDHPCVIEVIKQHYLHEPSSPKTPYRLKTDNFDSRTPANTSDIHHLLTNQTRGFFVECGTIDGDSVSNTIDLERKYGWIGILIEANPITFNKLKKNRKSWILPVCLSHEPYPTKVMFQPKLGIEGVDQDLVEVQCFPLYSILLAVGQTNIDFFSLDMKGHEIAVLKTIPFHKVSIKSLAVEWDNTLEKELAAT